MTNIIEVIQTKFQGYNLKAIEKDIRKITKRNLKMGKSEEKAFTDAVEFVDYYKHTYRIFN